MKEKRGGVEEGREKERKEREEKIRKKEKENKKGVALILNTIFDHGDNLGVMR